LNYIDFTEINFIEVNDRILCQRYKIHFLGNVSADRRSEEPLDQKVISIEEGLKRVRNNKVLYLRLLNNFNGHTLLNDIVQATENNDLDEVANAVHTLKGVSSNLAMNLLADVLEQMEVKLKAGENIESFIPILEENLKEIEESIKSFAAEVE